MKAIDILCKIFADATVDVIRAITDRNITYAKTIQTIPKICLKPPVGCFAQLDGDYKGILALTLSQQAAMDLYKGYMVKMGVPESELNESDLTREVVDSIGEILNQINGKAIRNVENKFELNASATQPKSLAFNNQITLTLGSDFTENRRLIFKVGKHKFQMEIGMESLEFIPLEISA